MGSLSYGTAAAPHAFRPSEHFQYKTAPFFRFERETAKLCEPKREILVHYGKLIYVFPRDSMNTKGYTSLASRKCRQFLLIACFLAHPDLKKPFLSCPLVYAWDYFSNHPFALTQKIVA